VINLFYNYFQSKSRQAEYDFCLKKNKEVFDRVLVFEGRHTFERMFSLTGKYPNDINVFCNSDIYFKEIESLNSIKEMECYALTRWDQKENDLKFFNRIDSQDAWVFRGEIKNIKANFYPGMWGCDNRLAFEIQKSGYRILNPSLSIITVHVHKEDNRNYVRTNENTVPPPYLTLNPCKI
jgi:hypothetical protein